MASAFGIRLAQARGVPIRGNQVRGLAVGTNGGSASGVYMFSNQYIDVRDNLLVGPLTFGVDCNDATSLARDNVITEASILPVNGCTDGGNLP